MGEYRKTMADRVLAGENEENFAASIDRAFIERSVIIDASNVVEFFFAGSDQEDWGPDDYPNLAPPFESFWVEARRPSMIRSKVFGEQKWRSPVTAWGALFGSSTDLHPKLYKPAKWTTYAIAFIERAADHTIVGPLPPVMWNVAEDGSWAFDRSQGDTRRAAGAFRYQLPSVPGVKPEDMQRLGDETATILLKPLMLAISFMHCANVTMKPLAPPPALSRRNQERHGHPLLRYHTLDIEPMRKVLRQEGRSDDVGPQRALHLCRGHFKDYRDSKGLFGKHKGLFWWDANVRGSIESGVVAKDYAIKPPSHGDE